MQLTTMHACVCVLSLMRLLSPTARSQLLINCLGSQSPSINLPSTAPGGCWQPLTGSEQLVPPHPAAPGNESVGTWRATSTVWNQDLVPGSLSCSEHGNTPQPAVNACRTVHLHLTQPLASCAVDPISPLDALCSKDLGPI